MTIGTVSIGECHAENAGGGHYELATLSGFSSLANVEAINIEGNEALVSAEIFDALMANGASAPLAVRVRYNLLLSEETINTQLDALGVFNREVCGNKDRVTECYCPIE